MAEGRLPEIASSGCRNKREHEEDRRKTGWRYKEAHEQKKPIGRPVGR